MAIIEKTAPNGQVIEFDTNEFNEEEIQEYLDLPKFKQEIPQANQQQEDTKTRNIATDIGLSALDGVRDGVQASVGLVEQLGDTLGEKTGFYGVGFGNGDGKFQFSDLKPNLLSYKDAQDKGLIDDKLTLPDFDKDPETIAGGITKGVTQFLTGWFTGGRALKGVKAVTGTGQLAKSVARGSIADFQAFDQDSGRLADMVNDFAPELENPIIDYLESDQDDTWYEARFKNALEGAFLGGALEGTFRAFRWYKNKKAQSNGQSYNKEQLKEDETILQYQLDNPPTSKGDNARLDDLTKTPSGDGFFPDDIYSSNGKRFYGVADEIVDKESFDAINKARNNPDLEITVYRGVPKGINSINEGDWVTLSKKYAEDHASGGYGRNGDEAGIVISKKVKVKDIYSTGNDVNEFGYSPSKDISPNIKPTQVVEGNPYLFDIEPSLLKKTEFENKNIKNYKGDKSEPIIATKINNEYKILDGHHRAKIADQEKSLARIFVIPETAYKEMKAKGINQGKMYDEFRASYKPEQNLKVDKVSPKVEPVRTPRVSDELSDTYQANLKTLEDGIFSTFKTAQDEYAKNGLNSKDFDELLDEMNISTQFSIKQLIDLDEAGLISEIAFEKTIRNLSKNRKIVVSDEMVERQARKLYENNPNALESDIQKLVKDLKNAPETVVAMNAYRGFLNSASKRLAHLARTDKTAKELWKRTFKKLVDLNNSKTKISAQFARTQRLQARSLETDVARDQNELIKKAELYGIDGDEDEFLRKWALTGDADVSKILTYVSKNRTWDIANEIWINALLSNPKTHIINMTSNMINMFLRPLEKSVGSLTGYLGSGKQARLLREEGMKAMSQYVSFGRYLKDAVKFAGLALKREDGILTSRNKLDTPKKSIQKKKIVNGKEVEDDSISGVIINTVGKIVRQPSRFLTAEDEFFKQIQYRTHLERFAFDKALKDGKSTTKIVGYELKGRKPITEFQQAVSDNFDNGFDKYGRAREDEVLKMAEEGTYTNELTGIMESVASLTNKYPVLKQIIPFTRTPVNLMLNVIDRTPLGFVRRQYRQDFFGLNGTERMAQARGQLATGFALTMLANKLVAEGHITGSQGQIRGEKITNSKELRDLKKSTGIIPYSFRYWDKEAQTYKYREFGRFDPFGTFLGLVVDFHTYRDQLDEESLQRAGSNLMLLLTQQGGGARDYLSGGQKLGNSISAIGSSVSRNLVSKTYLKGLADFMEVMSDDDPAKWGRYTKSKAGSFVPNIYTKLINDPFYRDTKGIFDELKKRSGSAEVEFKYDFRGNALRIQGDEKTRFVNGVFNPFGATKEKNDPVAKEIFRLGVNLPSMRTTLRGNVDLTLFVNKDGQTAYNRQQDLLRKVRIGGLSLDQKLQQVINSSGYPTLSDPKAIDKNNKDLGGKAKVLRRVVKDYHTAVEELLIKEAKNFSSTQDETGKFTMLNSLRAVNTNLEKLKMGVNVNSSDLNSLYQFSQ